MYTDCDQMIHQQHVQQVVNGNIQMSKVKNDSRITKVGRVLRATIIDELPQLINVIKGDMSLIGQDHIHAMKLSNIRIGIKDDC